MDFTDVAAAVGSLKSAVDIVQTMVGLRDTNLLQSKTIELQRHLSQALSEVIKTQEAHLAQAKRIYALEAEVADLKAWGAEKQRYELKPVGSGATAYMLKPGERGSEPPHWLCPTCYEQGKKATFQPTGKEVGRRHIYMCSACGGTLASDIDPAWVT